MRRRDLKSIDMKAWRELPPLQRQWLAEQAYIRDTSRNLQVMFPATLLAKVMSFKSGSLRGEYINDNLYSGVHYATVDLTLGATTYLNQSLDRVRSIRSNRNWRQPKTISVMSNVARSSADSAVSRAMPKQTERSRPIIKCVVGEAPRVVSTGDGYRSKESEGGTCYISVNWVRSVKDQGIAVLDWGANEKVLVCVAKHNPSVFLAEQGITCFDVMGMRLGIKTYEVNGYAFTTVIDGKRHAIFSENFQRGVTQLQNLIAEAFSIAMKVL